MSVKNLITMKYLPIAITVFIFIIYLFTLAPSVIQIDSGELAAVQATLGIAHPTGYPLFTIIGYLFLKIPFPITTIAKANLLAAVWCSLGVFLFIKSVLLTLNNTSIQKPNNKKQKTKTIKSVEPTENNYNLVLVSAIIGGLFLSFSKTFWMQSTSVEVYSLQIFLFTLIIFTSLKAFYSDNNKITNWKWVGFSLALGFSNHMTTILTLPLVSILYFMKEGFIKNSILKIGFTFLISLPILILFYSFLPLRALSNPEINWGNPVNWENFFRHITGKQYQIWLFSSAEAAKKQLFYFINNLTLEFTIVGIILALIGLILTFKYYKKLALVLSISFIVALLYSVNYDIVDIDSYFLFNYILIALFISTGSYYLLKTLAKFLRSKQLLISASIVIGLLPLIVNYSAVDQSDQFTFEDYTKSILNSVENNSIIFSYQWDYFISASYYYQFVENYRKDVVVIDKELLRRSWYYNQLQRNYPDVVNNIDYEVKNFLEALKPFEKDENYNPSILELRYRDVMTNLISKNSHRDYYIGLEIYANEMQRGEYTLPEGYQLVPHLLLFKAVKSNDYISAPDPDFVIRFSNNENRYTQFIKETIGRMLSYRILYEINWNKIDRAKMYYQKLRSLLPEFKVPEPIIKVLESTKQ